MGVAAKAEAFGRGRRPRLPRDRRLRLPLRLPHRRPGRLGRDGGVDVPAAASTHRASSRPCSIAARAPGAWAPAGLRAPVARRYVPGTNVLETSWMTPHRVVRRPRRPGAGSGRATRTATDVHARDLGRPRRRAPARPHGRVRPRRGRGRDDLRAGLRLRDRGRRAGRSSTRDGLAADASGGGETLRLLGDIPLEIDGPVARGVRTLETGERAFLVPVVARGARAGPRDAADAVGRIEGTINLLAPLAGGRARSPITPGAGPCSARRWRSRASPTSRPGRWSPR